VFCMYNLLTPLSFSMFFYKPWSHYVPALTDLLSGTSSTPRTSLEQELVF
jgi:hypothetical protein